MRERPETDELLMTVLARGLVAVGEGTAGTDTLGHDRRLGVMLEPPGRARESLLERCSVRFAARGRSSTGDSSRPRLLPPPPPCTLHAPSALHAYTNYITLTEKL